MSDGGNEEKDVGMESDSLARAIGAPTVFVQNKGKENERTWKVGALRAEEIGLIENIILQKRPNPILIITDLKDKIPTDDYDKLMTKAYKDATRANSVSDDERLEFMNTTEGATVMTWLSLEQYVDGFTKEDAKEFLLGLTDAEQEELGEAIMTASGQGELGNSTGRTSDQSPTNRTDSGSPGSNGKQKSGKKKSKKSAGAESSGT